MAKYGAQLNSISEGITQLNKKFGSKRAEQSESIKTPTQGETPPTDVELTVLQTFAASIWGEKVDGTAKMQNIVAQKGKKEISLLGKNGYLDKVIGALNAMKPKKPSDKAVKAQEDFYKNISQAAKAAASIDKTLNKLSQTITEQIAKKGADKENEDKKDLTVKITASGDLTKFFEQIKDFKLDKQTEEGLQTLEKLLAKGGQLDKIVTGFNEFSKRNDKSIEESHKTIMALAATYGMLNDLSKNTQKPLTFPGLEKSQENLQTAVNKMDAKEVQKAQTTIAIDANLILAVIGLAALFIVVGLLSSYIDEGEIAKFAAILAGFLFAVAGTLILVCKFWQDGAEKGLKAALGLVIGSALVLIIGGLMMKVIDPISIILFAGILLAFLILLSIPLLLYKMIGATLGKGLLYAIAFVMGAAFVLALGGIAMKVLNPVDLIVFTMIFAFFLLMISLPLLLMRLLAPFLTPGLVYAIAFVMGAAFVLILGGLTMKWIKVADLVKFTVLLSWFLWAITKILGTNSAQKIKNGKDLAYAMIFVGGAAAVMLLGGFFIRFIRWQDLLKFTLWLGLFLFAILKVMSIAGTSIKKEKKSINASGDLVFKAGLIMIIGGFLMRFIYLSDLILFTVCLSTFLLGICTAFRVGGKHLQSAMKTANKFLLLVGVSSLIMLAGAVIMKKYPELAITTALFTASLFGFIWGMLKAINYLWKRRKKVLDKDTKLSFMWLGIYTLGTLAVFTAIGAIAALVAKYGGWKEGAGLAVVVFAMGAIIFGMVRAVEYVWAHRKKLIDKDVKQAFMLMGIYAVGLLAITAGVVGLTALIAQVGGQEVIEGLIAIIVAEGGLLWGMVTATEYVHKHRKHIIDEDVKKAYIRLGIYTLGVEAMVAVTAGIAKLVTAIGGEDMLSNIVELIVADAGIIIGMVNATEYVWKYRKKITDKDTEKAFEKLGIFALGAAGITAIIAAVASYADPIKTPEMALIMVGIMYSLAGVAIIISKRKNDINKAGQAMTGMGILAAGAAAATAAIVLVSNQVTDLEKLAMTAVVMIGVIGALTIIAALAGKKNKQILEGSIAMIPVPIIAALGGLAMQTLAEAANKTKDIGKLIAVSTIMIVIVTIIVLGAVALGLAIGATGGLGGAALAAGEAAVAGAVAIAGLLGLAGISLANAAKAAGSWSNIGKMTVVALVMMGVATLIALDSVILGPLLPFVAIAIATVAVEIPLTSLMEKVMGNLANIDKTMKGKYGAMLGNVAILSAIFLALSLGISALAPFSWFVIAGAATIAAVAGACILMCKAVESLTTMVTNINKVKDVNIDPFISTIRKVIQIAKEMGGMLVYAAVLPLVTSTLSDMGTVIEKLAIAVKNYSELKIPTGWDKKGNAKGYRQLEFKDFDAAATNVKQIVEVLGTAIGQSAEAHPDWYSISFWDIKSPFTMCIENNMKLAKLIDKLAYAVKDYADLKIATAWDKEGKAKAWRHLDEKDFTSAAANVKTIIEVLGSAVGQAYDAHPDWYAWDIAGSPFQRVIKANIQLGKMLSKIATAVKDYADLKIAEDWDNEGKATKYRHLKENDFISAAKNVDLILKTMSGAIQKQIEDDTTGMYGSGWNSFIRMDTPIMRVIKANIELGKMLSKIAANVKDYADLKIAEDWDKDGKAISYRHLDRGDFKTAGKNVKTIIEILAQTVVDQYSEHPDYYQTGLIMKSYDDSPVSCVIQANMQMGEMLSKIAGNVKDFADLRIPSKWDDKGKTIEWKQLGKKDFKVAGQSIQQIISILSETINTEYEAHPEWYDPDLDDEENPFFKVIKSCTNMGEMLSSIASSVKDFADLRIPIKWDDKGKAIEWRQMDDKDFTTAGEAIQNIVGILGQTIFEFGKDHPEWFPEKIDEDADENAAADNQFQRILNGCTNIGGMISSIAKGVTDFASGKVPAINGQPERSLTDNDFKAAGKAITSVLSVMGKSVMDVYDKHQDDGWFDLPKKVVDGMFTDSVETDSNARTPFESVCTGTSMMGQMIANISDGVLKFASGKVPAIGGAKERQLNQTDFDNAAACIKSIISVVGSAIMETFGEHKDWFENPPKVEINTGFLGIGDSKTITPDNSDTPFQKVVNGLGTMGILISNIAGAVVQLATGVVPACGDQPARTIGLGDIAKADIAIFSIMTCIGNSLIRVSELEMYSSGGAVEAAGQAIGAAGQVVGNIAQAVVTIAGGSVPIAYDKDGKVTAALPIGDAQITAAGNAIEKIMTAMGNALIKTVKGHQEIFSVENITSTQDTYDANGKLVASKTDVKEGSASNAPGAIAAAAIGAMSGVITGAADAVVKLSTAQIADAWNDKGVATHYTRLDLDATIKTATDNIEKILTAIGSALVNTVNKHKEYFAVGTDVSKSLTKTERTEGSAANTPAMVAASAISGMVDLIEKVSDRLWMFAMWQIPDKWDSAGNAIHYKTYGEDMIFKAKDNAKTILTSLADALIEVKFKLEAAQMLGTGDDANSPVEQVNTALTDVCNLITQSSEALQKISEANDKVKLLKTGQFEILRKGIGDILTNTADLGVMFSTLNVAAMKQVLPEWHFGRATFLSIMNDVLHEYTNGTPEEIITSGFESVDNIIDELCYDINDIYKSYNDAKQALNFISDPVNKFASTITGTVDALINIVNDLVGKSSIDDKTKSPLEIIHDNETTYISFVDSSFNIINNLLDKVSILNQKTVALSDFNWVDTTVNVLKGYKYIVKILTEDFIGNVQKETQQQSSHFITNMAGWLTNKLGVEENSAAQTAINKMPSQQQFDELQTKVETFYNIIQKIIESVQQADETFVNRMQNVAVGITLINNTSGKLKKLNVDMLAQQTNSLGRYVKVINSVNVQNLNKMNQFVTALNKLAAKMGNLDNLTSAIANKLTVVLAKLVKELVHAENTIKEAEKLQTKRHKLIEESIKKVKEIMANPIAVEISQTMGGEGGTAGDEGNGGSGGSSGGGSTSGGSARLGGANNGQGDATAGAIKTLNSSINGNGF